MAACTERALDGGCESNACRFTVGSLGARQRLTWFCVRLGSIWSVTSDTAVPAQMPLGCILQLIVDAAASSGNLPMLEWLRGLGLGNWDEHYLTEMLSIAGMCGHLKLAKWFKEQGAHWPARMWHLDGGGVHGCWNISCFEWALNEVSMTTDTCERILLLSKSTVWCKAACANITCDFTATRLMNLRVSKCAVCVLAGI